MLRQSTNRHGFEWEETEGTEIFLSVLFVSKKCPKMLRDLALAVVLPGERLNMKLITKIRGLTLAGMLLLTQLALAQNQKPEASADGTQAPSQEELRFDLDFPGGSPADLVRAIEKVSGHPINVIIPTDAASVQLPALKMRDAGVAEFFAALSDSSLKLVRQPGGGLAQTRYRFQNQGNGRNAVWYFRQDQSAEPQVFCRYYQLADLLDQYNIDDITTAIQTGWKLLKIESPPQLKFHRETKLLIAVGPEGELVTIDSVLSELRKMHAPPSQRSKPAPKPEGDSEKK